ncbi:MAG: efflux RND transporter periplasmic adaptor subunit [Actinomycetota bacterium]
MNHVDATQRGTLQRGRAVLKRRPALLAGLAVVAAAGWWALGGPAKPPAEKPQVPAQPVVTRAVEAKPMPVLVSAVGAVQSMAVVSVRTRVEGEVVRQHFGEGQEVRQGELLFTLDLRPHDAARRQAEANLARDQAQLERARSDLKRYSELLKTGNAPVQKVEQATADARVYEAAVKADQAAIETARLMQEYAQIRAPISGRTGVVNAKPGNLAKPTDTQPMVTLTQLAPIYVSFAVPEYHLPRIRAAQGAGALPARVASASDPGLDESGPVTFIDSAIDQATGTIGLKATLDNPNSRLWPGQFVNVTLTLGVEPGALVVPAEAIQTGQAGAYVFVVRPDQTAEIRPVSVDRTIKGEAVVSKGLAAGETVVIDGQMRGGVGTGVAERKP